MGNSQTFYADTKWILHAEFLKTHPKPLGRQYIMAAFKRMALVNGLSQIRIHGSVVHYMFKSNFRF